MPELEQIRRELLEAVHQIEADRAFDLFLVRGDDLEHATPGKVSVVGGLDDRIASDVLAYATKIADKEWVHYDPAYQSAGHQALVDELAALPELERIHRSVVTNSAAADPADGGSILAMAHQVFTDRASGITAYRLKGRGIAVRSSKLSVVLLSRRGVLEPIEDSLVYYESSFDALVFRDHVFVTAPTTVSAQLGSTNRLRQLAKTTLRRAAQGVRIANFEALEELVDRVPQMALKLTSLARTLESDPSYADILTTKNLVAFLRDNEHIEIEVVGAGGKAELVFDASPQRRFLIPKLMADDFLTSALTRRNYEVGSKARLDE